MENHTHDCVACDGVLCSEEVPGPAILSELQGAIRAIVGKWKIEIAFTLRDGPLRFGQLRRALPGVTQHMLTTQLRELERHGLVRRTAYAEIPPRVEYELTDAAYALGPVFEALLAWSRQYGQGVARRDSPAMTAAAL